MYETVGYQLLPSLRSISIVVSTSLCGSDNPGSNPGYCTQYPSSYGLVGYDDRLTRGRSPVRFRVAVLFQDKNKNKLTVLNVDVSLCTTLLLLLTPWPSG